jgi:hypothetical protein
MSLHDKAILVSLSTAKYGLNRHDDNEAAAVAQRHGADSKSIGVTKRLLQGNAAFDAVRKFDSALHVWNRAQTLPWDDDGTRMLPTLQYDAYMTYVRSARASREALVAAFLADYDAFVQRDRGTLGTMFNSADYADRPTVRDRFAFKLDVQPVPDGKDFRVAVCKADMIDLQKNVDARLREAEDKARLDLFHRLAAPLLEIANKLGDGDKARSLRTTGPLVENLREILDLIPRLNITGDTKIMEFHAAAIDRLAHITPETMKENDLVRSVAARQAQSILDEMSDFMGPAPATLAAAA